jgi:N6-adenosine-specific RNA methylase IME4
MNPIETPDTVHGRLMESVHLSGYSFERAFGELEWLLDDDRWKRVGGGFDDINAFLATIDLSEFRLAIDQRKKIAKRLQQIEATQRDTAKLLGVGKGTIHRDLAPNGATSPKDKQKPEEKQTEEPAAAPNGAPEAWFHVNVDPSREAKRVTRRLMKPAARAKQLAEAIWPEGRYGIILGDPPWRPTEGLLDPTRQIENQYPTLPLQDLIALRPRVEALALDDCVLCLWATTQKLFEAVILIEAWGFTVQSGAVWIKPSIGMGYWFRGRHELLVLATRGNPMTPLEADRPDSVITAARAGHSEKPDEVYALIERMFPVVPKVEIFARAERPGWARATNELALRSA